MPFYEYSLDQLIEAPYFALSSPNAAYIYKSVMHQILMALNDFQTVVVPSYPLEKFFMVHGDLKPSNMFWDFEHKTIRIGTHLVSSSVIYGASHTTG